MATAKGHLDAIRKNQKSTKPAQAESEKQQDGARRTKMEEILHEPQDDYFPPQPENGKRTNVCFIAIYEARGSVSSDLTGRFPIPSSSGNHYIMCVYDYDANYIFQRATKNRTSKMLLECWDGVYKELVSGGCRPILHRLDNECSEAFKEFMKEREIAHQLVPPHDHRRNPAERAIRTSKNHFIAGMSSCDPECPMSTWDYMLPQS